jgi:segregation and condensation protein A
MRIKARMLLPRPDLTEDGQEIDPREELARKLIEYKRFKEVLDDLALMEEERQKMNPRGNSKTELKSLAAKALVDIELESLTLYSLFKSFENVMKQFDTRKNRPKHVVYKYDYTIEQQREYIIQKLKIKGKNTFQDIFTGLNDRLHCIITFLSLLELINSQFLKISNGMSINNFVIEPIEL